MATSQTQDLELSPSTVETKEEGFQHPFTSAPKPDLLEPPSLQNDMKSLLLLQEGQALLGTYVHSLSLIHMEFVEEKGLLVIPREDIHTKVTSNPEQCKQGQARISTTAIPRQTITLAKPFKSRACSKGKGIHTLLS